MKKMRIISKRILLGGVLAIVCSSTGNISAISLAERSRAIVKNRIDQLRTKAQSLLTLLDGYKQCVFKNTCTREQISNLRKAGAVVAAAITALLAVAAVTVFRKSKELEESKGQLKQQKEQSEKQLEAKQKELEGVQEEKEALAKQGMELEKQKKDIQYLFFVAVTAGKIDLALKQLNLGANIDERDLRGWTALDIAVSNKNEPMVKFLLQNRALRIVKSQAVTTTSMGIKEILKENKVTIITDLPAVSDISKRHSAPW